MKTYSIYFTEAYSILKDILGVLVSNYEYLIITYSLLLSLIIIFTLNRKISRIEKIQFNDIDDITSFNRLIDEEIGTLKKGQDELSQVLKMPEKKIYHSNQGKLFENAPYTQAVQLAKRGYAREDIISLCSLTESEVELILALHSNSKAA